MSITSTVALFFPVVFATILHRLYSTDLPQSEAARYYNQKPSFALRNAERHVQNLKSAFVCHELNKTNKSKCAPLQPVRLAQAIKRLEFFARRDRINLNLPKLPYKTTIIEPLVGPVQGTILDMHGYSGTGAFLIKEFIIPAIKCGILPGARFVLPTAWLKPDLIIFKRLVNSWYGGSESWTGFESAVWRRDEIFGAAGNISMTLDIMSSVMGISRDRAGVIGTSQGGSLAIVVHLRHKVKVAVSFVGFLPDPDAYPNEMTSLSAKNKIIMINTKTDEFFPFSYVQSNYLKLLSLGRNVELIEISGPHFTTNQKRKTEYADAYNLIRKEIGVRTTNPKGWKSGKCVDVDPVLWELS